MSVWMPNETGKMVELFKGAVLSTREHNGYDDSDFYAIVWNEEKQFLQNIEYNSTRYAGGGNATVDATDEVKAKAVAYGYASTKRDVFNQYVEELRVPVKGDTVRVTKGRKAVAGLSGLLFWVGEERTFGGWSKWSQNVSQKVGVALNDERDEKGLYKNVVWTQLTNLEVVNVAEKFKFSEAKRRLRGTKRNALGAWLLKRAPYTKNIFL